VEPARKHWGFRVLTPLS